MAVTRYEVLWLLQLFKDLGLKILMPVPLKFDNQATLHIATDPRQRGRLPFFQRSSQSRDNQDELCAFPAMPGRYDDQCRTNIATSKTFVQVGSFMCVSTPNLRGSVGRK